jgi:hypothetical protein
MTDLDPMLGHYTVRLPGMADRVFKDGADAIQFVVRQGHPSFVKIFGRDGELLVSRGTAKPDA